MEECVNLLLSHSVRFCINNQHIPRYNAVANPADELAKEANLQDELGT
jgi:hypothetical protein